MPVAKIEIDAVSRGLRKRWRKQQSTERQGSEKHSRLYHTAPLILNCQVSSRNVTRAVWLKLSWDFNSLSRLYRIAELYLVAENVLKIQRQAVQSCLRRGLSADDLENSLLHRCRHLCGLRYCRFRFPKGNAGHERGSVGKSDDCRVIISRFSNG